MFSFAGAKVRRFSAISQISKEENAKIFPFIDINQKHIPFTGEYLPKTDGFKHMFANIYQCYDKLS